MKRAFRLRLGILLLLSVFFSSCYVFKQGVYLFHYQRESEDIKSLLDSENLTADEKRTLRLVLEIKDFGVNRIGLAVDDNYSRYVKINKPYLVDVVTASNQDSFTAITWKYPIVGEVPYKGFYKRKDALKLVNKLEKNGFDVMIRQVDAFSTLGYFSDPLFSFMTDYSEYSLAELILHEQTHATLFIKNSVQFNEELATFMGNEGALLFLYEKYGKSMEVRKKIDLYREDQRTFLSLFENLYHELNEVYTSRMSREEKLDKKRIIIESFKTDSLANYNDHFSSPRYKTVFEGEINNAYILSLRTYTADLTLFYDLKDHFGGDLAETFKQIRKVEDYNGNPKEYLTSLLASE